MSRLTYMPQRIARIERRSGRGLVAELECGHRRLVMGCARAGDRTTCHPCTPAFVEATRRGRWNDK